MQWLWVVGPIAVILTFVLTGGRDRRAPVEIDLFRQWLADRRSEAEERRIARLEKQPDAKGKASYRDGAEKPAKKKKKAKAKKADLRPRRITPPADMLRILERAGEGSLVGHYEILPNLAYLTAMTGDLGGTADHQTVLMRLAAPAPRFTARPLPWEEGKPMQNHGIQFSKDPSFMNAYLVEGDTADAKKIGKWLVAPLRELLFETPEVFLFVEGKTMALTIYGTVRAEKMEKLLEVADVFFAEHGAEDGPSLFGDDDAERTAGRSARDEDDEDLDEDDEDLDEDDGDEEEDEDDEAPRAAAAS